MGTIADVVCREFKDLMRCAHADDHRFSWEKVVELAALVEANCLTLEGEEAQAKMIRTLGELWMPPGCARDLPGHLRWNSPEYNSQEYVCLALGRIARHML